MVEKAQVKIGGVTLAAIDSIVWRIQQGVRPYITTMSVHEDAWPQLESKLGQFVELEIRDARGRWGVFKKLTIMHIVPSSRPHLVSFQVADRRWKWNRKLVVRDYNVPKKTGDRIASIETLPVGGVVTIDAYEYRRSSLTPEDGLKWKSREIVEDILAQLEENESDWLIEAWPIRDDAEVAEEGTFSVQNVLLRDQGDVALGRVLGLVPGAGIYVRPDGKVVVFDAADVNAAESYAAVSGNPTGVGPLPFSTWDGEKIEIIDRKGIRPSKVNVYYEREVEVMFEFSDDFNSTAATPGEDTPFLENVIPTTDPETDIPDEWAGVPGQFTAVTVGPGTFVAVDRWLAAMDADRPDDTMEWSFKTAAATWATGHLQAAWSGKNGSADISLTAKISGRLDAFMQHFRQTFRINPRYMDRIRDIRAVRVGILHPFRAQRSPAAVWGQASRQLSSKGIRVSKPGDPTAEYGININFLEDHFTSGTRVIDNPPGPWRVTIIDKDTGIFHIDWVLSPFGTEASYIPCQLVNASGQTELPSRDLSLQNSRPMALGIAAEGNALGGLLDKTMQLRVILTVVPAAPNNKRQYHRLEVEAEDIEDIFETEFRIQDGAGPELDVFVPPGEATARFAWDDDATCKTTLITLFGLDAEGGNINEAGIEGTELDGFVQTNARNELPAHSQAVAAEAIAAFADSIQGRKATRFPSHDLKLVGNMSGASVQISAAPSAKVFSVHDFPGHLPPLSRMAVLPESVRHIILGILGPGIRPEQ